VSVALTYPVMVIDERSVRIKDAEDDLITTSVSSGGNYYPGCVFIDSGGTRYEVSGVWEFGRKSPWLDMDTSRYQVFLRFESKGPIELARAKQKVLDATLKPYEDRPDADVKRIATKKIRGAKTFAELLETSKDNFSRK
jgi:hypothetical protein